MISSLPRYVGRAWRAPSGFRPGGSAADVVRFEEGELGNDLGVSPSVMRALDALPASSIVWVARTWAGARRYGDDVQEETLPDDARIIYEDSDGALVLSP